MGRLGLRGRDIRATRGGGRASGVRLGPLLTGSFAAAPDAKAAAAANTAVTDMGDGGGIIIEAAAATGRTGDPGPRLSAAAAAAAAFAAAGGFRVGFEVGFGFGLGLPPRTYLSHYDESSECASTSAQSGEVANYQTERTVMGCGRPSF